VLECVKEMYECGLATGYEVEDAQADVNTDLLTLKMLSIQTLILENEIKIMEL